MKVSMVPNDDVDKLWPEIKDYLAGAAKYTYGRYTVEDIYECIKNKTHNLWIAFNDEKIKGAVVTGFSFYPQQKYLVMTFCGGEDFEQWKDQIITILQHFAFDTQCDGLEAAARLGWSKVLKEYGYKPLWQTFELPPAESGLGAKDE